MFENSSKSCEVIGLKRQSSDSTVEDQENYKKFLSALKDATEKFIQDLKQSK